MQSHLSQKIFRTTDGPEGLGFAPPANRHWGACNGLNQSSYINCICSCTTTASRSMAVQLLIAYSSLSLITATEEYNGITSRKLQVAAVGRRLSFIAAPLCTKQESSNGRKYSTRYLENPQSIEESTDIRKNTSSLKYIGLREDRAKTHINSFVVHCHSPVTAGNR